MTQAQPLVVQTPGVTYEAADFRGIFDQLFSEGVRDVAAGQLAVTALTDGTLRVAVATGTAYVKGDDQPLTQGLYVLRCTAAENVSVSAPPSSGSRLDLLVWEEIDADVVALAGRPAGSRFRAVPGTAVTTGSPVLPSLPPTAIPLASFPVAAGQTTIPAASIIDMRTQAGAASVQIGTQAQPRTTAQRDAIAVPFDGQLIYNTDTGAIEAGDSTSRTFASTRGLGFIFGNGSDGDVTITGTVTLTRDMQYRNLTVVAGAVLLTNGYRILATGTVRNAGTISVDGGAGQDGLYAAAFPSASFTYSATAGGAPGPGGGLGAAPRRLGYGADGGRGSFQYYDPSNGTSAYNANPGQSMPASYGGKGGDGGQQQSGVAGGSAFRALGGTVTALGVAPISPVLFDVFGPFGPFGLAVVSGAFTTFQGGAGGGGGGWGGSQGSNFTSRSGGGGGGGGVLVIVAETIVNTGTISANGGKGGNAGSANSGPGGGGGGGVVALFSRRIRDTGTTSVAGGAAGSGSSAAATPVGPGLPGNVYKIGL